MAENVTIAATALIQESQPESWFQQNKAHARYILLFVWMLVALVLSSAYKSNLLAILAMKRLHSFHCKSSALRKAFSRYQDPIEGPQDVLDQNLRLFLPAETATTRLLFEESPDPIMRRLYHEVAVAKNGLFDVKDR